ncbi:uncharacterized protein [Clinocottus analis]|uniref:uncharacterized protein n=1 Tax=Clinocottus analis TaxID=304258 RepID=UPI0035C23A1B
MERITLGCQVCLTTFDRVGRLKGHVYSQAHQKKSKDVFKQDVMTGQGTFPSITLIDQWSKKDIRQPITGLTLCFSRKSPGSFYLCQVCEEKCPSHNILYHLSTIDHCRNHFSHTNPNALRFSWIPSMNIEGVLRPEVTKAVKESGGRQLQVLDLPERLWEKVETSPYSDVMHTLRKNEKLLKLLEVVKPKQMTIQTYQRDGNREHPLLGMQHLVECISVGQTEKRHYLCTLCHLTLAAHAIVKHVLSFDHIFCYFKAWHPSTLLVKESYKDYTPSFASMMLDFAKQAEQIHGTANADMMQVRLEPTKFQSVNFTCYADALKELESIRKENKEGSLIVSVTPGMKLALKKPESKGKGKEASRLITNVTPGNKLEFRPIIYQLRCQNCSMSFPNMRQYCRHLSKYTHKQRVKKFFGGGNVCFPLFPTEWKPSLGLYKNLVNSSTRNQALVGVPLVVTCLCSQVQDEPIYVCFACEDCFTESFLRQHFNSHKHLIRTLLYQNPWRLTLGWEHRLDKKHLQSLALEEEEEKPDQRMVKVLDMPNGMFQRLVFRHSFKKVMDSLTLQLIILKRDVPPSETYSKLKENIRFPLLGRQFLVMYDVCVVGQQPTLAFLCLLCERRLSDEECYAHEFSRKHIATYLDRFHPGSLDSSTDDDSFLDLAKQAARYHTISHVQVMKLKKPIMEPCSYHCVSRKKLNDEDKGDVRDNVQENSGMMECLETTSQKSTDNSETTLKKTGEVGAEVTDTQALKSEEKGDDKNTLTVFHMTSEKGRGAFSETSSEDVHQSETCQTIKEKMETPTSGGPTENVQNADKNGMRNERNKSSKDVLTQKKEISSKDTCPVEDKGQEKNHKRHRLAFKEAPQNLPISGQSEVTTLDKGESGKPNHKMPKDEVSSKPIEQQADQLWQYLKRKKRDPVIGLSALLECSSAEHEPIYLCKCCSLKIPEEDIISHVTGVKHQMMYLVGLKKTLPPLGLNKEETIKQFAGLFEHKHGYGEAQIVELDDEIYNNFSKQDFDSALQTVKALQDKQDSDNELPSTSALSGAQPVDTIVLLHAQHEVMKMETDSEDSSSITTPMFIKTETTSNTTKVPPKSNEAHGKVSQSPSLSSNNLSKSSKDKAEMISNTTVGSCKIAATAKVVARSETAASSDFTGTIPTKSMTAISEFTTKSSDSTPDTTKSTAPNTKSIDTASKYTACTSSDTISGTTSTTSVTLSKPLESRTRTATEVRTAAGPSKAKPTGMFEATGRTAPSFEIENTSKCSENKSKAVVASQTVVKSKMPETSVECQNIKASVKTAHMKNSVRSTADVAPNINKTKAPAATHLTTSKNPPAETSHLCTNEKRPSESSFKVGLNQLIKVSCGQRKQVYCQLCSVRLLKSEHTCSTIHQFNYVKMKYPEWTCNASELGIKLQEVVKNLAKIERNVGSPSFPTVKVTIDVYKELADLSAEKALERLKAMLERGLGVSSPTTSNPGGFLRRQVSFADHHEASSPDDEIESSPNEEGSLAVGKLLRTQSSEPEANDQILDQLNSCSILNNNEPLVSPCTQDIGLAAAKMESRQGCALPPATDAQTSGCKETPEWKQQQERSPPEIQDTQKVLEGPRRTSPVKLFNPDQLFSAATVTSKKPDQPRPSQKAENALPMILLGESTEGCSHLSIYLKVMGADREPIIGMDFVWECRGLSSKPFFLCESCKVMLSSNDICQHMISKDHQFNFISSQKSQFLYFWPENYLLKHPDMYLEKWMKLELLKDIAQCLSKQERYVKTDAQLILLVPELYEHVRTAPFSKALEIVKNIKKEQKLSVTCQPSCTAQQKVQLPEAQQSPEESLSMEMQPAQALETNRRSDDERPDPRRSVSPLQRPLQELPVKQAGVYPGSTTFAVVCPPTLSMSSSNQHLPTRKRPFVESIEELMSDCTDQPNLKDPMPAKRKPTYNELQPIIQPSPESVSTESTSVNPAATSVPVSPQDEDIAPVYDHEDIPMAHLIALVKERKSALNASRCSATPGNGETTTPCANISLKSGAQDRQDFTSVQTVSEERRNFLKMVTNNSDPAYALEEKFNFSLDDSSSARGDLLFGATEAKAVSIMFPHASTADPCDPQHQRSINTQTTFGNTGQSNPSPIHCAVINSNPGHVPQPRDDTENDSTGARQLPINAIITVRSNQPQKQFVGGNNKEDLVEVNREETGSDQTPPSLVTHSLSSVSEICPSNVSGGYDQYNQMVYVTNRQSGYFASEAVASYATPNRPPLHTGSSFQFERYPTGGLYLPSQIYLNPPAVYRPPAANKEVVYCPRAANAEVMSQAFANSFNTSGEEFLSP